MATGVRDPRPGPPPETTTRNGTRSREERLVRRILVGLVVTVSLVSASAADAGVCGTIPDTPCVEHACSNDAPPLQIAGDELLCWSRVAGAASYRVLRDGVLCAELAPRWRTFHPGEQRKQQYAWVYAWPLCAPWSTGEVARLSVQACDFDALCGPVEGPVTFEHVPYACFSGAVGSRIPCFEGDPMGPLS